MLKPRTAQLTEIQYTLITEHDPNLITYIPPQEFHAPFLDLVKQLPKDMIQLDSGLEYYELTLRHDLDNPMRFNVIYPPNLSALLRLRPLQVTLFLINMKIDQIAEVTAELVKHHQPLHYYWLYNTTATGITGLPNVIGTPGEFLHSLVTNQSQIFDLLGFKTGAIAPQTPLLDNTTVGFPPFVPAQNTYFIANQLLGNFAYDENSSHIAQPGETALIEASKESFAHADTFERQQFILREIKKIDAVTLYGEDEEVIKKIHLTDTFLSPLVILAPFQNPDIKHFGRSKQKDESDLFFQAFQKTLNFEQTKNYTNTLKYSKELEAHPQLVQLIGQLNVFKSHFIDFAGFLHSTFRLSPLIRLPFQGKSLYRELSVFRTEAMNIITRPNNGKNINKTITRFGQALAERTLSAEMKEHIIKLNRQIVALSDMPFEWLELDGLPLAFSHDVCRLPETPIHGLMATFARNEQFSFDISQDLLSKTLVIFGSQENAFRVWQPLVVQMSKELGFAAKICLGVEQTIKAVRDQQPDLIIFDCHGGFDQVTNSSYLMLGKEKLTGDLIVKHQLAAPLVFLSACHTAPTYGTNHPVANAFFEAGSLSVTSTYLPINIRSSTILYIRLLRNLKMALDKPLHPNWLSFVAHTIRTSAITEAFNVIRSTKHTAAEQDEIAAIQARTHTLLMSFHHRRKVFEELETNLQQLNGKDQQIMSKLVPEYLFYTNLGRSDLVKFEIFSNKLRDLNK